MKLTLTRTDEAFQLTSKSEAGHTVVSDASESIGGQNTGMRPMEALLHSLAACSAIDILNILTKQKQKITNFQMEVEGKSKEGTPSPFESITIKTIISGKVDPPKLERAIDLTREKYCSVRFSLHPDIAIEYTYQIIES